MHCCSLLLQDATDLHIVSLQSSRTSIGIASSVRIDTSPSTPILSACCTPSSAPPSTPPSTPRKQYAHKPWDKICCRQQQRRRKKVLEFMEAIKMPVSALVSHYRAKDVLHLMHLYPFSYHRIAREMLPGLVPSRRSINEEREVMKALGAEVASTTVDGTPIAFVTDPKLYIETVTANSTFVAIGVDKGSDITKIGITCDNKHRVARFHPLVAYKGSDNYAELSTICSTLPFIGDTANTYSIWEMLQSYIDSHASTTFLSCDWLATNAVLGLMSPSSTFPCFICTVRKGYFELTEDNGGVACVQRKAEPTLKIRAQEHKPLLRIHRDYVAPLPLHCFLGLCNRVVSSVLPSMLDTDDTTVEAERNAVKRTPKGGIPAGAQDVFEMNGPECTKFIQQVRIQNLPIDESVTVHLQCWLELLKAHLLHAQRWDDDAIVAFYDTVRDILDHWTDVTVEALIPKHHMLVHCVEFASKHGFLGRLSEAPLEALHARWNVLQEKNYKHKGSDMEAKLKGVLQLFAFAGISAQQFADCGML